MATNNEGRGFPSNLVSHTVGKLYTREIKMSLRDGPIFMFSRWKNQTRNVPLCMDVMGPLIKSHIPFQHKVKNFK